jgi:ubiquinone/menaquinone biosynthesis C-methylase UbiE
MIVEEKIPIKSYTVGNHTIKCYSIEDANIDEKTVKSFGDEWELFHQFKLEEIQYLGDMYFDLLKPEMIGKDKTAIDFGCGSGRWTLYIHDKFHSIAAVDPSDSILVAAKLLDQIKNVNLYKASIGDLPFPDNSFDFGMSLGVLHHIPNTALALEQCVKKIKPGGYFLTYLYYDLDNRGFLYKFLFKIVNIIRNFICRLPKKLKIVACDIIALTVYLPISLMLRALKILGISERVRSKIPLFAYENTSFYVMRNDSLDRFGTPLEQRFSKKRIYEMMSNAGLTDIEFSPNNPFWHAVGKKK